MKRAPRLIGPGSSDTLVVEDNAVGRSLRCPGPGSSISSTNPRAGVPTSTGGMAIEDAGSPPSTSGDGGALAGRCKKGIGEKSGVLGVESLLNGVGPREMVAVGGAGGSGGKDECADVTKKTRSRARRYLPGAE